MDVHEPDENAMSVDGVSLDGRGTSRWGNIGSQQLARARGGLFQVDLVTRSAPTTFGNVR